jgi:hypothetical protein
MNDWITILTFTYPQEAYIVKAKLESEGIKSFIKDELTAQVNNLYSNAIGGVKVQVQEIDLDRAFKILKKLGYFEEPEQPENKLLLKIDEFTAKLPIIGKTIFAKRLFVVSSIIIVIIVFAIMFLGLPSLTSKLTKQYWSLQTLVYKGKQQKTKIHTIDFAYSKATHSSSCSNKGEVAFTGFDNFEFYANWKVKNNKLLIFESDSLATILNGKYSVDIDDNKLTLESTTTIMYCYKAWNMPCE